MPKSRTIHECDFAEIFCFAEEKYGIPWNDSNALFFRSGLLDYGQMTEAHPSEMPSYIPYMYDNKIEKSSEIPREVFESMEPIDKGRIILLAFGEAHGIKHSLQVMP